MKYISRHLPQVERKPIPLTGWIVISFLCALTIYYAITHVVAFVIIASIVALLLGAHILSENGRLNALQKYRKGDICTFRKSFDVRLIDPWIIRSTYEELSNYLSTDKGAFPIHADDRIDEDLKIDRDDLNDIAYDVAYRAGYDMADSDKNPLYDKVFTVRDFVMFFTHQPKLRDAEQGAAANP